MRRIFNILFVVFSFLVLFTETNYAAENASDLAKKLSNPVASLISVPLQFNSDYNIGPQDDGERYFVNIQPVIPFSISENWNLISRTILPITYQDDIFPGSGDQFGLGDTIQSLFFSPKLPTKNGIIWGVGPAILIPTATDELLGSEKLGLGPTAVALTQKGPWTIGGLFNHIWSVAGDNDRADINNTFVQPFLAYTTSDAWTFTLNSESTYNWEEDDLALPLNLMVTKLIQISGQPISIGGGLRYWVESAENGPEDFGGRIIVTFLFPK